MRFSTGAFAIIFPVLLFAQSPDREPVESLIKKLGNANFQVRSAATETLKSRPDSEPALRAALGAADSEIARRANEILAYFDTRVVRDLDAAVKDGRIEAAIKLLANWSHEKYEDEAWSSFCTLNRKLLEAHEKVGGGKLAMENGWPRGRPFTISAKRITEKTKLKEDRVYYFRAAEVDIDVSRLKPPEKIPDVSCLIVAVTGESFRSSILGSSVVIFSGGNGDISGEATNSIIVSCADLTLNCELKNCLIIARGKVNSLGRVLNSRVIAGKSVTYRLNATRDCMISENDQNPLGFIRWSDTPKVKADPKAK